MGQIKQDLRETQTIGARTRERVVPAAACPALGMHHLVSVGLSEAEEGFRWVRERPSVSVILACTHGYGYVLVDGSWCVCGQGMIYLAPPSEIHAYHAVEGVRWRLCWVIHEQAKAQPPLVAAPAPLLDRAEPWPLYASIQGLYGERIGPGDPAVMHHWVELVHLHAQRMTRHRDRDERLWRLWEEVDADLARRWSIEDLASVACTSGEYLRRLCHEQTGRSPGRHVTYLRMQRAASLLKTTDWTLETVARAVGYENVFAFSTAFKRWIGVPPSAYREGTGASAIPRPAGDGDV